MNQNGEPNTYEEYFDKYCLLHGLNARLIAAAPILLGVAEAFCVDYCPSPAELALWRAKFRAAIRAARGESNDS